MKHNFTLFIFLILLIIPLSSAAVSDYTQVGAGNSYSFDDTKFNIALPSTSISTRAIASNFMPLFADLDNDTTFEIIVIDGNTLKLFQNKTLDSLDNIVMTNISSSSTVAKHMVIANIDNDVFKEIIVTNDGGSAIEIFQWDGITLSHQQHHEASLGSPNEGYRMVGCDNSSKACLLVGSTRADTTAGDDILRFRFFNSTDISATGPVLETGSGSSNQVLFCPPKIRQMTVKDYDNDGNTEFIFSYVRMHQALDDGIKYAVLDYNAANLSASAQQIVVVDNDDELSNSDSCDEISGDFTDTLVFDVDDGGNDEVIIGMQTFSISSGDASNSFVMRMFNTNGDEVDRFPEVLTAAGTIVSNVILTNAFPDSPDMTDFCVMGHDNSSLIGENNELDLLCASKQRDQTSFFSFLTSESSGFSYDLVGSSGFVLPENKGIDYASMIHSIQAQQTLTEGNDLREIISTYGIFELTGQTAALEFDKLGLIFRNPRDNGTVIMVDSENTGFQDMLVLSPSNLYYIDDQFVNQPAVVDSFSSNPCIESVWEVGNNSGTGRRTAQITVTPTDPEGDKVRARVTLYHSDPNGKEQASNFSSNVSSGTEIPFNFDINETISNGIIRLVVTDTINPSVENFEDLSFSVGQNGVAFGDCRTDKDFEPLVNDTQAGIDAAKAAQGANLGDNSLGNIVGDIAFDTGMGTTVTWLLFLLILSVGIFGVCAKEQNDFRMAAIVVGVVNTLGIVIGVLVGFINIGVIIVAAIIGIAIAAVVFRRNLAGGA